VQVVSVDALQTYPLVIHQHGLMSSTLGLRIYISSRDFIEGQMKVRCVASVSPVLWQSDRESVVQRFPSPIERREALILGKCKPADVKNMRQGVKIDDLLL